ncbi:unnamed protein product [Parajaminaea phylloscopi]
MPPVHRGQSSNALLLKGLLIAASVVLPSKSSISSACGTLSFIVWLFAQSPQILTNYRRGSVEGLSLVFLGQWMAGDVTNLLGCILTDQLTFQKVTAAWFCLVDVVLLAQFAVYSRRSRIAEQSRLDASAVKSRANSTIVPTRSRSMTAERDERTALLQTSSIAALDEMYESLYSPLMTQRSHGQRTRSSSVRTLGLGHEHPFAVPQRCAYCRSKQLRSGPTSGDELPDMSASADLGSVTERHRMGRKRRATSQTAPSSPTQTLAEVNRGRRRGREGIGSLWADGLNSSRVGIAEAAPAARVRSAHVTPSNSRSSSKRRGRPAVRSAHAPAAHADARTQGPWPLSQAQSEASISRSRELVGEEALKVANMLAEHLHRQHSTHGRRPSHWHEAANNSHHQHRSESRRAEDVLSSAKTSRATSRSASIVSSPACDGACRCFSVDRHRSRQALPSGAKIRYDGAGPNIAGRLLKGQVDAMPRIDSIASGSGSSSDPDIGGLPLAMGRPAPRGVSALSEGRGPAPIAQSDAFSRRVSRLRQPNWAQVIGVLLLISLAGYAVHLMRMSRVPNSSTINTGFATMNQSRTPREHSNNCSVLANSRSRMQPLVRHTWLPAAGDRDPDGDIPPLSKRLLIGRLLSWLCTLLYLTSRLPQIYTNHIRQSVAGLSILLFCSAFTGNLLYSISIVTNPLADGKDDGGDFWRECLPFLIGSAGTLVFDAVVVAQWWVWGHREPGKHRNGRETRKRRRRRLDKGKHGHDCQAGTGDPCNHRCKPRHLQGGVGYSYGAVASGVDAAEEHATC